MDLQRKIEENIHYWSDEWEPDDYSVFKMELDEDELEELPRINWDGYGDIVYDYWLVDHYLYIELDEVCLQEEYDKHMRDWTLGDKLLRKGYYSDLL